MLSEHSMTQLKELNFMVDLSRQHYKNSKMETKG